MDEVEMHPSSSTSASTISVGSKISFNSFAKLLENLSKINAASVKGKEDQKRKEIETFIQMWNKTASDLNEHSNDVKVTNNFFPVLRMLLPSEDRRIYGLKESKLAVFLIKALGLSDRSEDAVKLSNYASYHADFGSSAFDVLNKRLLKQNTEKSFSIEEINKYLDSISYNNARGKEGQLEVRNIIVKLIMKMNALQLKWLIRIILKDLKIGVKEHIVLEAFHPDATNLYNFTSSLEEVCEKLNDPKKRINEILIQLFQPCYPMLGEKAKPNKIETLLKNQSFYIETKYDGERFQLHKSNDKYGYYSRNSHDYSDTFGRDPTNGSLSPFIHHAFSKDVKSIILDGEMCGYNSYENILLTSKGEYDVKSNSRHWDNIHTCYVVFDILMFNNQVLTNKPLKERIEYLKKAFNEIEDRIIVSNRELCTTNQQVVDALNRAIDNRLEGIVVKDPSSVYQPNVRSSSGWFKVKPDYMLGLNDDLDLLIVGAYIGEGKRAGLLSHFLLAVAVDDPSASIETNKSKNQQKEDDDDLDFECVSEKSKSTTISSHPKKFYSFCKIGSGYSIQELYDFNLKLKDKWHKFDKKNPPAHLELTYEKPDKWIDPKDSIIVQVKAVEIVSTDKYKTGCTLRFPRLEKFRDDKPWHQCMKLSELIELKDKNEGKLTSGKHYDLNECDEDGNLIDYENDGEPVSKKKKRNVNLNNVKKATVDSRFRGIDASTVNQISDIFKGKEFCVINGTNKYDKQQLEKKIAEFGGSLVQNPDKETTFCLIASKVIHKVSLYISKGFYDIVHADWLIQCIESKSFLMWKPGDMIYSKPETERMFSKSYDQYGDSYDQDCTVESLKEIFSKMESKITNKNYAKLREQIAEFENEYYPDDSKHGLFRLECFYFDLYENINDGCKKLKNDNGLSLISIKARWHGGLISDFIDENTTKCIVNKDDKSSLEKLKTINRKRDYKFRIISSDWINHCISKSRLVDELPYHL